MANVSDGDIGGNDWKDDSDGTRWKDGGGGGCESLIGVSIYDNRGKDENLMTVTMTLMATVNLKRLWRMSLMATLMAMIEKMALMAPIEKMIVAAVRL